MDTQTQVERLIELAIIQRAELKRLVDELPQLREHLNSEVERTFEETEPQIRSELEEFVSKQAEDKTAKLGSALEARVSELAKTLQDSAQAKFSAILAERDQNADLLAKAEQKIAAAAAALPSNVKEIVLAELDRFPRAGEIDRLRKEFAEPRGLNPRGKWSSSEIYQKLDLVSYNGDSFVSSINGNRERPSRNSEAWTLSAARGLGGSGGGLSLKDQYGGGDYGQVLIGNGGDFSVNTLTAGTGVTIDNGAGTITISAAGGGGQTLTATVYNAEASPITKGQVVYIYQANGNKPSVKLASNSSESTSSKTFGVVSDTSIAAGATGTVMCQGEVSGLNLGSYTEGATVYLGSTPGSFTQTKPYAPSHLVYVGVITRANASGIIYVKVQNGYELDEIHDVQITNPVAAGSTLLFDATNSLWKNGTLTAGTNIAITNADASATIAFSGTLPLTSGGTGATTQAGAANAVLPSQSSQSGKYLTTDGSNVSWATVSAGGTGTVTSVSVTTANGVSGTVANATTTPAISLTLGAITPSSVAATGSVSGSNLSGTNTGDQTISIAGDVTAAGGTGALSATVTKINGTSLAALSTGILKNTTGTGVPSIAVAGDFPTLNQNTTGTAANVTGTVAVANGGTGATDAATARTNLGLGTVATQAASNVALTGGSASNLKVLELIEDGTASATAATGALNYDVKTQTMLFYTSNASANWTLNIRGDGSTTLDSLMAVGDSMTLAFLVTQGATAYYCTAITIDGAANTPKWQGGTAPTAGNASGIDAYTYTVIKTASATFTVLAAQTQFK